MKRGSALGEGVPGKNCTPGNSDYTLYEAPCTCTANGYGQYNCTMKHETKSIQTTTDTSCLGG